MSSDDLNAPLGQNKRKNLPKLPIGAPQILAGVLALFGLAVVAWPIFVNDPLGGEPTAVVAISPAKTQAKSAGDGPAVQKASSEKAPSENAPSASAGADAAPPGSKTITIIDGSSGKHLNVIVPGKSSDLAPKTPVDQRLQELTSHGALVLSAASLRGCA